MKTKDVLTFVGAVVIAYSVGNLVGKVEALNEVLNKDEITVESLTVKLCKGANLIAFKKHTNEEEA